MDPLHGVDFILGDFRRESVLKQPEILLEGKRVGLVLSDMAPNISGVPVSDQTRVMHLAELGLEFSRAWLKPEGRSGQSFQGYGYEEFVRG